MVCGEVTIVHCKR